jgi:hypothetical protein
MQEHGYAALQRLHFHDRDIKRWVAAADAGKQRFHFSRTAARELMEQRDMRRHEIALRRIVAAPQLLETGEGLPVHLQSEHEGLSARS